MRKLLLIGMACATLASCGKPSNSKSAEDQCASSRGAPGLQTDAQAQQACRDNKKFLGPDAKNPNTKIDNN